MSTAAVQPAIASEDAIANRVEPRWGLAFPEEMARMMRHEAKDPMTTNESRFVVSRLPSSWVI